MFWVLTVTMSTKQSKYFDNIRQLSLWILDSRLTETAGYRTISMIKTQVVVKSCHIRQRAKNKDGLDVMVVISH